MTPLRLTALLAHPDDESLGIGGTLAKYAAEGVATSIVVATRGQRGRYRGHREPPDHPGPEALGRLREIELRRAAAVLGVSDVTVLDYVDQDLDRAEPLVAIAALAAHLRRLRPQVVVTFPPDGAYGHPDHIAISQLASAAVVAAADPSFQQDACAWTPPHRVDKLYYVAWPQSTWDIYEEAFRRLVSTVDGVARQASAWPDWQLTTVIDTRAHWQRVLEAVSCHESQVTAYEGLERLPRERHEALWGSQSFYRVFSFVNGGRRIEGDLFEGLR